MHDPRLMKMAQVLAHYSLGLRQGDRLMIISAPPAETLVELVFSEALAAGSLPEAALEPQGIRRIYLERASDLQFEDISPRERLVVESYDAILKISAPSNTRDLTTISPDRLSARSRATEGLQRLFMTRAAEGSLRWTGTLFPTEALAQDADMSLHEYEDFVYAACLLNDVDPVASWRRVHDEQERIVSYLGQKSRFRVRSADVDLRFHAGGRTWINSDGRRNFPSGEVFTCPLEASMDGRVTFSFPAIVMGREIAGVTMEFRDGVVIRASAQKGQELLDQLLGTDEGACRVGEIAIGTNYGITQFTRNILFDEKIGGTMHLAIGAAYPDTGGINSSAIHVDLIADLRSGGEYYADDELFYKDGAFLI